MPFFINQLIFFIMNITQEKIDDLNAILRVKVTPEDYQSQYAAALKKQGKEVNIPGFRPGHVPSGLIKKKYGPTLLAEELNKMLSAAVQKYVVDNKLDILGNPLPKHDDENQGDWANPGDFEFTYELGLAPEFKLSISKKNKFTLQKIKADQKQVDTQINNLAKRFGKMSNVDVASSKDMVIGDFVELDANGIIVEGGVFNTSTVSLEFLDHKKAQDLLVGSKVGETKKVDPRDLSKGDADLAAMLNVKKDALVNLSSQFNFNIKEIKRLASAELNEELFAKLFGNDTVKTAEEFEAKIREDLEGRYNQDSQHLLRRDIAKAIIEKTEFKLPDTFLKKWIIASNEKPISPEQMETEYDGYAEGLKWQLIQNRIIKENDLKVEPQEAENHTAKLIADQFAQYGMPAPEGEEMKNQISRVLGNQDEVRRIYDMLFESKVIDHVKTLVKIDEKEISFEEFSKLAS
ncbi:MAG: trigger factor [Flavobacteriales bacterium]|jgi:trigger factor